MNDMHVVQDSLKKFHSFIDFPNWKIVDLVEENKSLKEKVKELENKLNDIQ